jgi:DUF2075 family protein/SOS-response transcriptional repressor LexA
VHYVTKNAAPRAVYESKLTGTLKKTSINNLFKSSGAYHALEPDCMDALVVDEAHRLNAKSGMYQNQGENQIKEVIRAGRLSVFFLDEAQRVTWKDIGGRDEILRHARDAGAAVEELQLESQFRCNGSDGYLAWLDHTLQIRATANEEFGDVDFDFRVCDSPAELACLIEQRNRETGRARLVAGYCWPWASKKKAGATDIGFPEYGFAKQWNLSEDGSLWILKSDSIDQVGCIHTCQGLELDYVGVIVGPDLVVREGVVETHPEARAKQDSSLKGYKTELKRDRAAAQRQAAAIIKNTYRTLMTRGQKGCYVWSTDPETNHWFRQAFAGATAEAERPPYGRLPACPERTPTSAIKTNLLAAPSSQPSSLLARVSYPGLTLPILTPAAARRSGNAAHIFDVVALAGAFSEEQEADESGAGDWVELPPEFRVTEGMFVVRVEGESMNRRIPSGSWCLFKRVGAGTREGKIVLARHREVTDAEHGGHYTVKQYHRVRPEESRRQRGESQIELRPLSTDPTHQPLVFNAEDADSLTILAELVAVL